MKNIYALVMAGGKGTRFWPESTSKRPKQYLSLSNNGNKSLLQETLERFGNLVGASQRYIVTVKEQAELAKNCAGKHMANDGLIFEPSGRNTAPCIMLGLAKFLKIGAKENDVIAIVPSDHVILNEKGFQLTLEKAANLAKNHNSIVTIGIRPHFPHTGYGYIKSGEKIGNGLKVKAFKEKPNRETAEKYVASGEYYWNAGMFVSTIGSLLSEFEACSPETFKYFASLKEAYGNDEEIQRVYNEIPKDSIDYAVMEKSEKVLVVPAEFDWNDLGSWDALESVVNPTDQNTVVKARGHHFLDSSGNIIFAPGKFVSLIGVENHIIVCNESSLVVLPKEKSQEIKKVVTYIQENANLSDLL